MEGDGLSEFSLDCGGSRSEALSVDTFSVQLRIVLTNPGPAVLDVEMAFRI